MSQDIAAAPQAENEEVKETLENQDEPTGEDADADLEGNDGDADENKKDSFYEEQLKALQEENDRLQKIADEAKQAHDREIEIKNRAIKALKRDRNDKPTDRDSLKQEVIGEIRTELARDSAKKYVEAITQDKTQRELFMRQYDKTQKTGDVETDVRNAVALANAPRIFDLLNHDRSSEEQEDRAISSMGGEGVRSARVSSKTILEKTVSRLLPKEAHKHIKNNLPR